MGRLIWKWTRRVLVTAGALFIVVYFGDWVVYKLRGSPHSHVRMNQTIIIPLKGNKQEYDYLGASDVPCSVSIFSQNGEDACWQLRRDQNKPSQM